MRYLWSMVAFIFVSLVWNSSLFLDLYINGDKIYFYKLDHIMNTDTVYYIMMWIGTVVILTFGHFVSLMMSRIDKNLDKALEENVIDEKVNGNKVSWKVMGNILDHF